MTDQEILSLFKQKGQEEKAFGELLRSYQEKLYWHIRRLVIHHDDADDVLQNTFIKIWKALPGFREESKLYTWIYRIATNEAFSFLNQKKKRFALRIDDPEQGAIEKLSGDEYFDGDAVQKKLIAVVDKLPTKQQLVFRLKYYNDLKYKEIAEMLNISIGALKASYHHAVKKIEKAFKED